MAPKSTHLKPKHSHSNNNNNSSSNLRSSNAAAIASIDRWKFDLTALLKNANKRFADIAWAIEPGGSESIWAHKAIIYARASGQFQLKYLAAPAPSPHSRLPPIPSNSSIYLDHSLRSTTPLSVQQNQIRPSSPGTLSLNSLAGSVRQLAILNGTDPTLFQSILEALYTANGLSEVFAFLFDDHPAGDSPEARSDKLRKDLLYMWRSKLYADCRIVLVNQQDLDSRPDPRLLEEEAVFSAHRSILCSRSPYFASLLLDPYADANNRVFTLASPPFTPASLHFSLGYLYCGTLDFSNRNFDLGTAMQIWRSAQYLGLDLLREEVEAKISDMCHSFKDLCKSCVSRIGRVYAFALALDVASKPLEQAAEPFVVKHFSVIWNKAIGELHYEAQTHLVDLVCMSIDPNTVIDAIRGSKRLKDRLANERSDWADHLLSMLEPVDEQIGVILQQKFPAVVTSKGFLDLLVGVGFSNDVLEKALVIMVDKLTEETAAETYQVLVGQVLLREDGLPMDARVIVEDAKAGLLKFLKSHWTNVRALNGFDPLENWALKEISDEIEVQVDDLLLSASPETPRTKTGLRLASTASKATVREETRSISAASLRASVLSRNASRHPPALVPGQSKQASRMSMSGSISTVNGTRAARAQESPLPSSPSSAGASRAKPNGVCRPSGSSATSPTAQRPAASSSSPKALVEQRRPSQKSISPPLPSRSTHSEPDGETASSSRTTDRASSKPLPPLPSIPSSGEPRPPRKLTKSSRPNSPAPSATSVGSKISSKRPPSSMSRSRRAPEAVTSFPEPSSAGRSSRSRTVTASSPAVSGRASVASGTRRPSGSSKPLVVRKTPSSVSMRSDTSTATIGAFRTTRTPKSPAAATAADKAGARKTGAAAVVLAPSKQPERLRTTSATARTGAAVGVRAAVPAAALKRPSSAASVRSTAAKLGGAGTPGKAPAQVVKTGAGAGAGGAAKGKAKVRSPAVVPPLPKSDSAPTTRVRTESTTSSRIHSPVLSPRAARARRPTQTSAPSSATTALVAEPERTEVLAEAEVGSEEVTRGGVMSHQSKGSTVSNATIRMGPGRVASETPSTIVVPPSSTAIIQPPVGTKPPGTSLLIGIPCVVATSSVQPDGVPHPVKFRAVVKYLGETFFGPGQWVGVEVGEKEDMPSKAWNDGTVDGVRYFELGQESKESRVRLFRNLTATPGGGDRSVSRMSSVQGVEEARSVNSLRPSIGSGSRCHTDGSGSVAGSSVEEERAPTRGLFVRPQEVIFVF